MNMKRKHLTFEERQTIKSMLDKKESFKSIARELGRDCSTISKEVKNHIIFKKTGCFGHSFNDCLNKKDCTQKNLCNSTDCRYQTCSFCTFCYLHCADYQKQYCDIYNKPPYVCNGCEYRRKCTLEKHLYDPFEAQREYEYVRKESRTGICISEKEAFTLDEIITPLLKKGQSIHHILTHNKSTIMFSEKTIYNYVDAGIFTARNIDMPRKVRYRKRKSRHDQFKVDKACRIGSVGGKVLLTIHFVKAEFMLAFIRESNTASSVQKIFDELFQLLGIDEFQNLFPVILADNGTEFSDPTAIEFDLTGNRRTHMFYCDPSAPHQKGACENNHALIRRILPKGTSFDNLTQEDINLMMNHINSYTRKNLNNKCPIEVFEEIYGVEILKALEVTRIDANDITLLPELLK